MKAGCKHLNYQLCPLVESLFDKVRHQGTRIAELERFLMESGLCVHCGDTLDKNFGCQCDQGKPLDGKKEQTQ